MSEYIDDTPLQLQARFPYGVYYRSADVDRGWLPLLVVLDAALAEIDPDYTVDQIKEKFGTLRFYARTSKPNDRELSTRFYDLISEAEEDSAYTCEKCGKHTDIGLSWIGNWARTFCPTCAGKAREARKSMYDMYKS